MANHTEFLPWSWTITSTDPAVSTCPSVSHILSTFAIVNAIVSAIALVFGHRVVVNFITRGLLGKPESRSWVFMWIVPVALQLAANALIAYIIRKAPGYSADFHIFELMLFLLARPRLSWIILGFFAGGGKKIVAVPEKPKSIKSKGSYEALIISETEDVEHGVIPVEDRPWLNAFLTQFIAEVVLQLGSLYIMGRTAHFAATHGLYEASKTHLYKSLPPGAHMMYAGALYYLIAGSLGLIIAIIAVILLLALSGERQDKGANVVIAYCLIFFLLISTWMGSWLFWAGFVKLAGNMYCPPRLTTHAVIWTLFSSVGIFLGAGV